MICILRFRFMEEIIVLDLLVLKILISKSINSINSYFDV